MPSMKRLSALLFGILLCWGISGCASIPPPPDIFVFESMDQHLATDPVSGHLVLTPSPTCMAQIGEMSCGHGVSIMTGQELFVGETRLYKSKPWSQLKAESVFLPAVESYAPLATYLINTCKRFSCSAQLDAFRVKLNSLSGVAGALLNH